MKIFHLQLTVDGVSSESGQTAPLLVLRGEEPRPRPELVPTQSLLMGDRIVRDKALRFKTVTV